jgi:hypothetical protein
VILQNLKFPVIVNKNFKGDLIASEDIPKHNTTVDFNLLEPAVFTLRLIYDENKKTKSMIQIII